MYICVNSLKILQYLRLIVTGTTHVSKKLSHETAEPGICIFPGPGKISELCAADKMPRVFAFAQSALQSQSISLTLAA